ncbi:MAG: type II secretion system protein [Candidatus Saccharimonadales bacterium]
MNLQQIKNLKEEKGFTIVELLIVIVVIGILAAIIIVAYTGVQNQARTTKAKSNASTIQKRLEAYYAENEGSYPTVSGWTSYTTAHPNAAGSIPANITVQTAAPSKGDNIQLQYCRSGATAPTAVSQATGYRINWFDYVEGGVSDVTKAIHGGDAKDTGYTCAAL